MPFQEQTKIEIDAALAAKENQRRIRAYLKTFAVTPEQAAQKLGITDIASFFGSEIPNDHSVLENFWRELIQADDIVLKKCGLDPQTDRPKKDKNKDMRFMKSRLQKAGIMVQPSRKTHGRAFYQVEQVPC